MAMVPSEFLETTFELSRKVTSELYTLTTYRDFSTLSTLKLSLARARQVFLCPFSLVVSDVLP